MAATERVLGQAVDEATQRKLIGSFIAQLGEAQP
jgi:F0F1-type ATP synthase membrane subunit b/b'